MNGQLQQLTHIFTTAINNFKIKIGFERSKYCSSDVRYYVM